MWDGQIMLMTEMCLFTHVTLSMVNADHWLHMFTFIMVQDPGYNYKMNKIKVISTWSPQ